MISSQDSHSRDIARPAFIVVLSMQLLFVVLFYMFALSESVLPIAHLLLVLLVAVASICSVQFGFFVLLINVGTSAWISRFEVGSYPEILTLMAAVAVICMTARLMATGRPLVVRKWHWAMAAFAAIAGFSGALAYLRYSTFQPIADYGFLNISTNIWGVPSGSVLGSVLETSSVYIVWGGLLFIASQIEWTDTFKRRIFLAITFILLLNAIAVLAQEFIDPHAFGGLDLHHKRRSGLMSDFNTLGHTAALMLVMLPVFFNRSRLQLAAGSVALVAALVCIFYSGSRAPLLLLFLAAVIGGLVLLKDRRWKKKEIITGGVAIALVISLLAILLFTGVLSSVPLVQRLLNQLSGDSMLLKFFNARSIMWPNAVAMIATHPFSGYGAGTYFAEVGNMSATLGRPIAVVDNALNLYLNVAAELGIPALALLLFVFLLILLFGGAKKRGIERPWRIRYARIVFISMLLSMIFGPHILSLSTALVFWLCAAFILNDDHVAKGEANIDSTRLIAVFTAVVVLAVVAMFATDQSHDRYDQWQQYRWHIDSNFYPPEVGGDGSFWIGDLAVRTSVPTRQFYFIKWRAGDPNAAKTMPNVEFTWDSELVEKRVVSDESWHYTIIDTGARQPEQRLLIIRTLPSWIPDEVFGNGDSRRLGLRIGAIDSVDEPLFSDLEFWPWETDGERDYQWSKQQSFRSVPLFKGPLSFEVRASHGDIAAAPVKVEVRLNTVLVEEFELSNTAWRRITIDPTSLPADSIPDWHPALRGELRGFLEISVDRTWQPSEHGTSPDTRELGVAVTRIEVADAQE